MKLPIALQLYSVRDEMAADFKGTLKAVHEMGYDGVEFAGLFGKTADEVKKLCAAYDLTPVSAHVAYGEMMKDPEGVCKTYKEIGCFQVVIPYLDREYLPGSEKWEEFKESVIKLSGICKKYGLILAYHNHDFEFEKIDGENKLDIMYRTFSEDVLQTQVDTCWANVGGEDPSAYVRKYAGRCPTVHLKDFVGEKSEHMYQLIGKEEDKEAAFGFRPCGYGKQDMPAILKASAESGAKWVIVEQDSPALDKTPIENVEMSIKYLKNL